MGCEQVLGRLWEYLDQQLGPEEAESVQAHLRSCTGCYPAFCCDRAFLQLLARQRTSCSAPLALQLAIRHRLSN
jgi:anti-sigma factor (TIGR02949 family)